MYIVRFPSECKLADQGKMLSEQEWEEENRKSYPDHRRMKYVYEKTSLVFNLSEIYSTCSLPAWLLPGLGLLHLFSHTFPHPIKPPPFPSHIWSLLPLPRHPHVQIILFWKPFCTPFVPQGKAGSVVTLPFALIRDEDMCGLHKQALGLRRLHTLL